MVDTSKLNVVYFDNNKDVIEFFETVTVHSWTWERLTEEEKKKFNELHVLDKLKGTNNQRIDSLNLIYHAFLLGLGYDNPNWRDEMETK